MANLQRPPSFVATSCRKAISSFSDGNARFGIHTGPCPDLSQKWPADSVADPEVANEAQGTYMYCLCFSESGGSAELVETPLLSTRTPTRGRQIATAKQRKPRNVPAESVKKGV